jgi:hypothetical protein
MAVAPVGSFDFFQVLNWGSSPARLRLGKSDCGPAERVVFKHRASAFKRTRVFVDSGF